MCVYVCVCVCCIFFCVCTYAYENIFCFFSFVVVSRAKNFYINNKINCPISSSRFSSLLSPPLLSPPSFPHSYIINNI